MKITSDQTFSVSDPDFTFEKAAAAAEDKGAAFLLENGLPKYLILKITDDLDLSLPDEMLQDLARRIIADNREAFERLAK